MQFKCQLPLNHKLSTSRHLNSLKGLKRFPEEVGVVGGWERILVPQMTRVKMRMKNAGWIFLAGFNEVKKKVNQNARMLKLWKATRLNEFFKRNAQLLRII